MSLTPHTAMENKRIILTYLISYALTLIKNLPKEGLPKLATKHLILLENGLLECKTAYHVPVNCKSKEIVTHVW
jgi:hypothetical protein